jgi:hypothetical protein
LKLIIINNCFKISFNILLKGQMAKDYSGSYEIAKQITMPKPGKEHLQLGLTKS